MSKLNSSISIDCVIFGFDFERLHVLLADRVLQQDGATLIDDKTLMGNHIYEDEGLDEAARRVLFDLTGLDNIYLEQFRTFGNPNRVLQQSDQLWIKSQGRDPHNRVVSVGYVALLTKRNVVLEWKGRNVGWYAVNEINKLAFDHLQIMNDALAYIRHKIELEPAIGFELMPQKFTLSQLQSMYEVVFNQTLDKRNFRRKALKMSYIVDIDEKLTGLANKPARLYSFSREAYEQSKRKQQINIFF